MSNHSQMQWLTLDPTGLQIYSGKKHIGTAHYAGNPSVDLYEAQANVRLMVCAPELLAALKGVLRVADRATDEFDAARAAISKAEGETI